MRVDKMAVSGYQKIDISDRGWIMKRSGVVSVLFAAVAVLMPQLGQAAAKSTLVEQRILTQEGLAIALASTVLQSQLQILVASIFDSPGCTALVGGAGSIKLLSYHKNHQVIKAGTRVYFDRKCKKPYIKAQATITADKSSDTYNVVETADYSGPTGLVLGSMAINENAYFTQGNGTVSLTGVSGLGRFTPANGAPPVDLGLECTFPVGGNFTRHPVPCAGGIAQDFPDLSTALASVTPLKLDFTKTGRNNYQVSFAGNKSLMVSGAQGALSVTTPTTSSLGIGGTYTRYTTAETAGSTASFALFPPTPTFWTITDSKNDTKFSIAVVDDDTRNSTGTVTKISTGAVLASFAVDQSGTGTITYSDSTPASITGWLLSD